MEVELDSDESDEVSIGEIKMETCKICSVEFDRAEHSPKVLPCCSIKACMKCLQVWDHYRCFILSCHWLI